MDELAAHAARERFEMDGPEGDTGQVVAVQTGFQQIRVDPLGSEDFEREGVADADVQISLKFSADA